MPIAANRYYSSPPSPHNIGMTYHWSPSAVNTGSVSNTTGQWVVAQSPLISSVSTSTPIGGSSIVTGVILQANQNRSLLYIQDIGTTPLYVAFNASAAGTGNFNLLLKGATSLTAGDGGVFQSAAYQGPVSISGAANSLFSIWEA